MYAIRSYYDDEAFLAAQGVLLKDMKKIQEDAKENKCSVFHQFFV